MEQSKEILYIYYIYLYLISNQIPEIEIADVFYWNSLNDRIFGNRLKTQLQSYHVGRKIKLTLKWRTNTNDIGQPVYSDTFETVGFRKGCLQ